MCDSEEMVQRKGTVRDRPGLDILECAACGLVALGSHEHIHEQFYEKSGMHGEEPIPIEAWLKETEWDDQRRFEMLEATLK